ncbi:hypothetical protein sos41_30840 [Alphaproteobacteria bacterium SO-S41]|nr:hypothetical protein sos41_30840 [Alphaproteobacteria bacterium SO-S41]
MRAVKLTISALLALLVTACIPEFANPLTGGNPADPAIIGAWTGKASGDKDDMLVDITAAGDGVSVVVRDPEGATGGKDLTFKGTTAEAGGVRYANLTPVGEDLGGEVGFMIFRYELKDGKISVWALDATAIAAAIDKGLLKGTTTGSGTDTSPKITASSDEIAAFFATPDGQAAFASGTGDILVLTRATP